ncbi:hypothetical protein BJV78DRAFT_1242296 [Lactifluus subvellereus]|nr:hypothetical protein BJV78DRAFT_1242296 [Lactifluus subvellereus]
MLPPTPTTHISPSFSMPPNGLIAMVPSLSSSYPAVLVHPFWHCWIQKMPMSIFVEPSPARHSRVISPSIWNLVLPRTPSPPPRLEMTLPVIDCKIVHGTHSPGTENLNSARHLRLLPHYFHFLRS